MRVAVLLLALLVAHPMPSDDRPSTLEAGGMRSGTIDTGSATVTSPQLERYAAAATRGVTFEVRVPDSATYRIELASHHFDPYLVLRDDEGNVLTEDDDGWLWKHWFAAAGVPDVHLPPFPGRLSTALAIEAAAAGQGVALISDDLAERDLKDGRLVRFSNFGMSFGAYYLVYLKSALRQRAVQTFRTWLLKRSEEFRQAM